MRVQRTRSSPSAPRSPLTRCPLGGTKAAVARRDPAWRLRCCEEPAVITLGEAYA
jgi:hypothetical protein